MTGNNKSRMLDFPPMGRKRVRAVTAAVCDYFNVDEAYLTDPSRDGARNFARQVWMTVLYHDVAMTSTDVGALIGRDHSTLCDESVVLKWVKHTVFMNKMVKYRGKQGEKCGKHFPPLDDTAERSVDAVTLFYTTPDTRIIPLTRGYSTLVDATDYDWLASYKWSFNEGYATCARAQVVEGFRRMHQLLLPVDPGYQVDHSNRNKLDNRRSNLRIATKQQNACNMGLRADSVTGYKGVSPRHQRMGVRYWARIRVHNVSINLGRFDTPEEAALAYNDAARHYFSEFAYLNDVNGVHVQARAS